MKKLKVLCMVLVLSLLSGCGSSGNVTESSTDGKMKWKLAHIRPEGTRTDDSARWLSEQLSEKTDGRIEIEIYPNSELGDYAVVQERIGLGDVELQLASVGYNVDRTLAVQVAPYIVTDWDIAKELYNIEDGLIANYVADRLEQQNIKLLAVYPQYFGAVVLAKEPADPYNPDAAKGLKIRVPSSKSWDELGRGLGFQTTPLPSSEIFTSIQTGVVDGAIGAGTEGYYTQYKELINYVMPIKTHFECHWLYMNKDLYDGLSDKDRSALDELAKELEAAAFKQAEEEDVKYDQLFKDEGTTVYGFTDEQIEVYSNKIRSEVWPELEKEFGKEIFDQIKDAIGYK
ncbi:TRAP transporter substrate-binding protein DctP [Tissierella sp. Yu-01]|uniref:TRAP transporter substrate-binding protein DctP n=1 Tax=Tissierella sp. Yu-01 TaxID=3035694 RepID=UPI00240E4083|nr:TRAP transporter substrate-binding protein DctP [Tissierella sp. Yu-01]WFA08575.1 TRAP transporter substrate-binding protein DctP [Tissierella sp. Yu-01]